MRAMSSPQTLKMRTRFTKPKLPLTRSEKKRRVIVATIHKFKSTSDFQVFRGKITVYFYFVKFSVLLVELPEHPTINLFYLVIFVFKEENNLHSFERSELERNSPYITVPA